MADVPTVIPADAPLAAQITPSPTGAAPQAISADSPLASQISDVPAPVGVPASLPADAPVQSQDDYLKQLPRDEIVREYRKSVASGQNPDKDAFYRAYEARVHEGNLLGDKDLRPDATPQPSLFSKVLDVAKSLDEGLFTQANEAGKLLLGRDLARSGAKVSSLEQGQSAANLVEGSGLAALRTANTLRQFGVNAANYLFHHNNLIASAEGVQNEGASARDSALFREQFDTDAKVQELEDHLLSGGRHTDPSLVAGVAQSPISDPSFVLPFALAGRAGEAAQAFRTLDAVPVKAIEGTKVFGPLSTALARPVELAANGVRAAAELTDKSPLVRAGVAGAATLAVGGSAPQAVLAGLLGEAVGRVELIQKVLEGTEANLRGAAGKIAGRQALGPYSKFAANVFAQATDEGKALLLSQVPNAPFLLGSENRKDAENFAIVGLLAHGAGKGVGMATSGLNVAKNYFAPYDGVGEPRLPTKDLGVSPTLDAEHAKVMSSINDAGSNFVEGWRNFLKKTGVGEMYAVTPEGFKSALDEIAATAGVTPESLLPAGVSAERAAQQNGVQLSVPMPEGKTRKVALIAVRPGVPGIAAGHEITHMIFKSLSDEQQTAVRSAIARDYGPEQIEAFRRKYAQGLGVDDKSVDTLEAIDELFAETGSALLNSVPVSRFGPPNSSTWGSTVRKIYGVIGTALSNAGISVPEAAQLRAIESADGSIAHIWDSAKGSGPKTGLGAQPSIPGARLLENYLQAMALDKGVFTPEAVSITGAQTEKVSPIEETRVIPPEPRFKKDDVLGEVHSSDGTLIAEEAKIVKLLGDRDGVHYYEIHYTDPVDGQRKSGNVPENFLYSPNKAAKGAKAVPVDNGMPKHPITAESPVGATPGEPTKAADLVTPRQIENTTRPEATGGVPVPPVGSYIKVGEAFRTELGLPSQKTVREGPVIRLQKDPVTGDLVPIIKDIHTGLESPVSEWTDSHVSVQRPNALKNVHVTPAQHEAFAQKATPEVAKANTETIKQADTLPTHQKPAYETEYYSAKGETGEDATVRESRRKLADVAEKTGKPNPLRAIYQKIFVPYRYVEGKTPRVFGFSYDKLIQNADILKGWAATNKRADLVARLSDSRFANTVRDYLKNQANGYGGNGQALNLPADTRPGSITTRNPNFKPIDISPKDARLVNLLVGIELPQKSSPASQFAAKMARENGLTPTLNSAGVEVTNPLYSELTAAGFDPKLLNSVVENLPIDRMTSKLKPRPDINFPAGDVGITRAGFMPATEKSVRQAFEESSHYSTKYPVRKSELLDRVNKQFWGRSGQERRNAIIAAIKSSEGTKVSFDEVMSKLKGELQKDAELQAELNKIPAEQRSQLSSSRRRLDESAAQLGVEPSFMPGATPRGASPELPEPKLGSFTERAGRPRAQEDEFSRHSSFVEAPKGGVILHSAKLRSTGYLDAKRAETFRSEIEAAPSQAAKDQIIESHFMPAGRGKQDLNIGLNVKDGEPNSVEHVLSVLQKHGITPDRHEVRESGTEPTLIARIPKTDDATLHKISEELKQDAIAVQNPDGTGKLLGPNAAAWGDFNSDFFLSPTATAAERRQALKDSFHSTLPEAPAEFVGIQEGLRPGKDFELFNLTKDIPGHPEGSTVSRKTLEEAGYNVPPRTGSFMPAGKIDSTEFKNWFGDSKAVDESGNPKVLFHGTSNDFTKFSRKKRSPESDLGRGFYFTDSLSDVSKNYAGMGPDLTSRVEQIAERLMSDNDALSSEEAKKQALAEVTDHGGATMPVYVKLENPAILGGDRETYLDSEYSTRGNLKGALPKFLSALGKLADAHGGDSTTLVPDLLEKFPDGASLRDVMGAAKESEGLAYAEDRNGNLVSSDLIRQAVQKLGFDGFIDRTVNSKFGYERKSGAGMAGMDPDTTHYIVFDPTHVKSAIGNAGTYDPKNSDIRFMPAAKMQHAGEPLEHSLGDKTLNLVHFGQPNQQNVDPKNFGKSGLTPRSELSGIPRSYFYEQGKVNKNDPVLDRNDVYGAKVSGSKIYDGDKDPLGYGDIVNREKADTMLQDAGYVGIARSNGKFRQIELFEPTKVQSLESPTARFMPAPPKDSEAFQNWFGGSHIVDAHGEPLVMYHGTRSKFTEFETPSYFTEDKRDAQEYAHGQEGGRARTVPVYLSLKNPKVIDDFGSFAEITPKDLAKMKSEGYDGVILKKMTSREPVMAAVFDPAQVKSATANSGAFDPKNPDIRFMPKASPKQEAAFKDSKVRGPDGKLLPVFHGTYSDFKKFEKGDLGYHFGTQEAANARIGKALADVSGPEVSAENAFDAFREVRENMPPGARGAIEGIAEGSRTLPVFLDIKNPLRMPDVGPWDHPDAVFRGLPHLLQGKLSKETRESVVKFQKERALETPTIAARKRLDLAGSLALGKLRDDLQSLGYDGVVYRNEFEGSKSSYDLGVDENGRRLPSPDSYIAFDNKQILPAFAHDAKARFMPTEKTAIPGESDPRDTRPYKNLVKYLTPEEAENIRKDTAQKMLDLYKELPADEDFEAASKAGSIKKGWYKRAADSLRFIFGPDTERFVGLVAAMSPQQSVQENLRMSLQVWADWQDAGRPLDTDGLTEIVERHADIHARVPNSVRALQGYDLAEAPVSSRSVDKNARLSGMKVESFRRNLLGDLTPSTNDTWMANFANIDQSQFGTKSGYLAYNAKIRKVADKLDIKPAEVQETIWSFFKILTEGTTVDRSAKDTLHSLTESDILQTPEFHEQILNDPKVKVQLERLGFKGFDTLAGKSNPVLPRPGSLHSLVVDEGGERSRLSLGRIAGRVQALKDLEVSRESAMAPAGPDPF